VSGGTAMADDGFEKMLGSLLPSVVGRLLEQDAALRAAVKDSAALQVRYAEHGPPMRASVRQRILENFRMSPLVQRRLSEGVPMERLFGGAARLPCHPGTHFEVPVTVRGVQGTPSAKKEPFETKFVLRGILEMPTEKCWAVSRPTADAVTTTSTLLP